MRKKILSLQKKPTIYMWDLVLILLWGWHGCSTNKMGLFDWSARIVVPRAATHSISRWIVTIFWLSKSTYTLFLSALLLPALKIPTHPSCSQYIVVDVLNPSPNMQTLPNEASVDICSLVYSRASAKSDDSGCLCLRHSGRCGESISKHGDCWSTTPPTSFI